MDDKPRLAVYKFSSCDGCQLALLNLGEDLLTLCELVDIVHFAEAGWVAPDAPADIALIEGSVTTAEEIKRLRAIRNNAKLVITLGACATAGGIQALRNGRDHADWMASVYASPGYIDSLTTSTPIAAHIQVDFELWGCPVTGAQVTAALRQLLHGVMPVDERDSVCGDCKRRQQVCVLVARGAPCLGPVTRTGCGALCPRHGRACYGCFGPAETHNTDALGTRLAGFGLLPADNARRFDFITGAAPAFADAAHRLRDGS